MALHLNAVLDVDYLTARRGGGPSSPAFLRANCRDPKRPLVLFGLA